MQRELRRAGVMARLEQVRMALRQPAFEAIVKTGITWSEVSKPLQSLDQVRDHAMAALHAMGIDTAGIDLKVTWQPPNGPLTFRAVLKMEVAHAAIAAAKAKEQRVPV